MARTTQFRQGDVLIETVRSIPTGAAPQSEPVLAKGEVTGHAHRVESRGFVALLLLHGAMYLRIRDEPATVVHEEHAPITLAPGDYRVWLQREYDPLGDRSVED